MMTTNFAPELVALAAEVDRLPLSLAARLRLADATLARVIHADVLRRGRRQRLGVPAMPKISSSAMPRIRGYHGWFVYLGGKQRKTGEPFDATTLGRAMATTATKLSAEQRMLLNEAHAAILDQAAMARGRELGKLRAAATQIQTHLAGRGKGHSGKGHWGKGRTKRSSHP